MIFSSDVSKIQLDKCFEKFKLSFNYRTLKGWATIKLLPNLAR